MAHKVSWLCLPLMKNNSKLLNWLPAIVMMMIIFLFSARPENKLPNFDWADVLVKKTSHIIVYALLGSSYWHGLGRRKDRLWLAWLLAVLYAVTDEYHQVFSPGRHPSPFDVMIFDNIGALLGLWIFSRYQKQNDQADASDR